LDEKEEEAPMKVLSNGSSSVRLHPVLFTYTLTDVEALKPEPFMIGMKNYIQRLEFTLSGSTDQPRYSSWRSIARNLDDDFYFGSQLKKKIEIPEMEQGLSGLSAPVERLKYIHQFVRTSFAWDGVEDYLSLNVKKINRERKGSTGDINLVLINLLRHHGIDAYPLLCSTIENGIVNPIIVDPKQFNTLYVLVKMDGKKYILNGADKYNPTHLVPYDVMNTKALMLIGEEEPRWEDIWQPTQIDKNSVAYMAQVAEDGLVSGNAYVTSGGYARAPRLKSLEAGKEQFAKKHFRSDNNTFALTDLMVKNETADSLDLVQQFNFSLKMKTTGDYHFLNTNLFTGLEENPFLAATRISDINFRYNRKINLNARIVLPKTFIPETLPANIMLIMPDTSISFLRTYEVADNVITLRQSLEFNRPIFGADEYPEFREFYKKLFDFLNEQVVLKRKN
jgi:hypothetical protein